MGLFGGSSSKQKQSQSQSQSPRRQSSAAPAAGGNKAQKRVQKRNGGDTNVVEMTVVDLDNLERKVKIEVNILETIETVKALVEVKLRIPAHEQEISFGGVGLDDDDRLAELGLAAGDTLHMRKRVGAPLLQAGAPAGRAQFQPMESFLTGNWPGGFAFGASDSFGTILNDFLQSATGSVHHSARPGGPALPAQPHQPQSQAASSRRQQPSGGHPAGMSPAVSDEMERREAIEASKAAAVHFYPQTLRRYDMVYIAIKLNSTACHALVDTGAQVSVISTRCARKCGMLRDIDEEYQGVAQGVGVTRIIGRIHTAQIQIGKSFFPTSFNVLDSRNNAIELIIGLDFLYGNDATISLKRRQMTIGSETVSFVADGFGREG